MNRVTVKFTDGSSESRNVRYYRGHANNPMSDDELEDKLREQAGSLIPNEELEALVSAIWSFDEAASADSLFDWRVAERQPSHVAG